MEDTKNKLRKWDTLALAWYGHIAEVKIKTVPTQALLHSRLRLSDKSYSSDIHSSVMATWKKLQNLLIPGQSIDSLHFLSPCLPSGKEKVRLYKMDSACNSSISAVFNARHINRTTSNFKNG